jgi:peptidyl-prolyl cis-trans isomerase C
MGKPTEDVHQPRWVIFFVNTRSNGMAKNSMMVVFGLVVLLILSSFGSSVSLGAGEKDVKKEKASVAAGKDTKKEKAAVTNTGASKDKVAVVNGTVITRSDYDTEMSRFERQMAMSGQAQNPAEMSEMKGRVLDGLVDRELLKQDAKKLGISVDDNDVSQQVAILKQKFGTEKEFTDTLVRMNMSEADLKSQLRQDLAIKKLIDQQIASKVTITPEEMKAFYDSHPEFFKAPERVRASHILIKVEPNASDADKAKARERIVAIQERLKKGEDFAAIAKESSECPSGANGGDLDYFQRGQMVGPFEDAAFALKPGTTSDIVETQFGYHLIKATDKKDASTVSYDDIKAKIEDYIKQQKVNELLTQYVGQLKKGAKIETFLN